MEVIFCAAEECTLCMACKNICPVNAVMIKTDQWGYEKIIINLEKCIDCGMCSAVCKRRHSVIRNAPIQSFAAQMTDKNKIKYSASGGAFQMLGTIVLEEGGICYGAESEYKDDVFSVHHVRISSLEELNRILNSKYIPSMIGMTYKQAKEDLVNGKTVLFSGTPCQILGLKAYLNKEYENLLTLDLICHGITSTKMFNDYIEQIEKRQSIKIVDYLFRDKSISWGTNYCYHYYKQEDPLKKVKIKHCPREASSYMIHYLRGNIFRENCYTCKLASIERVSDFTVGDYWEIESEHPEFIIQNKPRINLKLGVSCIMLNTKKAKQYQSKLREKMVIHEVTLESIVIHNDNLMKSSKRGEGRNEILEIYRQNGYEAIEKRYEETVGNKKIIYSIKNIIKGYLPDWIRILVYRTPFLRKLVFH